MEQLGSGIWSFKGQEGEEEVPALDTPALERTGLIDGSLQDAACAGGERKQATTGFARSPFAEGLHLDTDCGQGSHIKCFRSRPRGREGHPEGMCRLGILIVQESEQEMVGSEAAVATAPSLFGGGSQHQLPDIDSQSLRHCPISLSVLGVN